MQARFASSGKSDWDYIGRTSPAIPALRAVQDYVQFYVNPYPRYKKHTSPSAEKDIKSLQHYYEVNKIHKSQKRAHETDGGSPDFLREGAEPEALSATIQRWVENRRGSCSMKEDWSKYREV
jgi:hypothetical protein